MLDATLLLMMGGLWVAHLVVLLVLTIPVVILWRKRVRWFWWELSAGLLPFVCWVGAAMVGLTNITYASQAFFPFILSFVAAAGVALRVYLGRRPNERTIALLIQAQLCVVAVVLPMFVPGIGEPVTRLS